MLFCLSHVLGFQLFLTSIYNLQPVTNHTVVVILRLEIYERGQQCFFKSSFQSSIIAVDRALNNMPSDDDR